MLMGSDALWLLAAALIVDGLIGDPGWIWRRIPHPVVLIGRLIAAFERATNREGMAHQIRRAAGIVLTALLVLLSVSVGYALEAGFRLLPGGSVLIVLAASVLIAQRSLYIHVAAVRDAMRLGIHEARQAVSMIVGRDPDSLDSSGVARAAIESCAENFSDGVVAPAFWFAIGGLPGLIAYKAINTADSMVGHRSERYAAFGWASARLDDLVNLVPARLSGLLIALVARAGGGSLRLAFTTMGHDASLHRSPNAGWPEAAMAGALDVSLAGPRHYGDEVVDDAWMNPAGRPTADAGDIAGALRITLAAWVIMLATVLFAAAIVSTL